MAIWRTFFSDEIIRRLEMLPGSPAVVAAWTRAQVRYFDEETGQPLGDQVIDTDQPVPAPDSDAWRDLHRRLTAPNDVTLPLVTLADASLHATADGSVWLVQRGGSDVRLVCDGRSTWLSFGRQPSIAPAAPADQPAEAEATASDDDDPFEDGLTVVALALDRVDGWSAALDATGRLHLHQQRTHSGTFDIGLKPHADWRPAVVIADGGSPVYATDGQQLVRVNAAGVLERRLTLHYTVGQMVCSPDGRRLLVSEFEVGVLRAYDGAELRPIRQRFALDLLLEVRRPPLDRRQPVTGMALGPLAITNRGKIAFAVAGALCVTNLTRLGAVPRLRNE